MDRMIIFDDDRGQLGPMTDLRASFEIRTGALTTATRIASLRPKTLCGYWVPKRLAALVGERANAPVNRLPEDEAILCVNGRWPMPDANLRVDVGHALVESGTGDVVAAHLRRADAEYFLTTGQLSERVHTQETDQRVLYRHPWDILALAYETIAHDILHHRILDAQVPEGTADFIGDHPVEIHRTALVYPNVVFDAERGPIDVHEHAVIRPGAVLCGPCAIGPHCTVIDRTLVKPNCAFGPHCKIAGEVGGVIFQGYANKAHDGHLGDSWVGKWANFGAGTTNSNLLNTYGAVSMRVEPDGPRQRTGLTFLGAIVGDHAKFAINTRIMTGSVIGTGAMVACTAPPPVTTPRFAWLTDDAPAGEKRFRLDKFVQTMAAMMARRRIDPSDAYLEAIRALHERTAERASVG